MDAISSLKEKVTDRKTDQNEKDGFSPFIEKVIVHKVNHHEDDEPDLSDWEMPIKKWEEFKKDIEKILQDYSPSEPADTVKKIKESDSYTNLTEIEQPNLTLILDIINNNNNPDTKDMKKEIYSIIDGPKNAVDLLKSSIKTYYEHKYIYDGEFISSSKDDSIRKYSEEIIEHPNEFAEKSKEIARRLFKVMKEGSRTKSISVGDLMICLCKEKPESEYCLALLKMDPKDSFVDSVININGKKFIKIEKKANVIPTGVLQKFAYIYPCEKETGEKKKGENYGLKVLDFQQRRVGEFSPIASFFSTFLGCKILMNPQQLTLAAIQIFSQIMEKMRSKLGDIQTDNFLDELFKALQQGFFDAVVLVDKSIPKKEDAKTILEAIKKKLPTLVFKPEMPKGMMLTSKTVFFGECGLKVEINSDCVGSDNVLNYEWNQDKTECIVTIKTSYWEEKVHLKKEKQSQK